MSNDYLPAVVAPPIAGNTALDVPQARRLLNAFLAGRSPSTLKAYSADVNDFADFVQASTADAAAAQLLAHGPGPANELALHYKANLQARGLAAATVNRRLAALRSLTKLARTLGLIGWVLEIPALERSPTATRPAVG